jgi:hypothetical protein
MKLKKSDIWNITTLAAFNAQAKLKSARGEEVKLIGTAIDEAITAYCLGKVNRKAAIEARPALQADRTCVKGKMLKEYRVPKMAKLVTTLRKELVKATTALRSAGTKLAKEVASDLEAAASRSKEAYETRRDVIAAR